MPSKSHIQLRAHVITSPEIMQATVKKEAKVASTIKITICSLDEADYLLSKVVIVAGKTRPVVRQHDILSDTQFTTCGKLDHIMLRCPNPEQTYSFLYTSHYLIKDYKCYVHGCGGKNS